MGGPSATVGEGRDGRGGPGGEFGVFFAVEALAGDGYFWFRGDGGNGFGLGLGLGLGLAAFDGVLKGFEGGAVGAFVGVEVALEAGEAFAGFRRGG